MCRWRKPAQVAGEAEARPGWSSGGHWTAGLLGPGGLRLELSSELLHAQRCRKLELQRGTVNVAVGAAMADQRPEAC